MTTTRGARVSYDRVTVVVVVCACLPRGAFLFDLGYRLLTNKSFYGYSSFYNSLICRGGHTLDPVLGFLDLWVYTVVGSEATSSKHNVASSTGFFASFSSCITIIKRKTKSKKKQKKTRTATPADRPVQNVQGLFSVSAKLLCCKTIKGKTEPCSTNLMVYFLILWKWWRRDTSGEE